MQMVWGGGRMISDNAVRKTDLGNSRVRCRGAYVGVRSNCPRESAKTPEWTSCANCGLATWDVHEVDHVSCGGEWLKAVECGRRTYLIKRVRFYQGDPALDWV